MFKNDKTVAFYTLGCKLNFSETSTISRNLINAGFKKTEFDSGADLFVINTCSVTENANKECHRLIRKAKLKSPNSYIIITGCYAQLKPKIISQIAGVDMVVGANKKFNIHELVNKIENQDNVKIHGCEINDLDYSSSFSLNERTRSFLKIQDGCDYVCTYCTIPLARGKGRCDTIKNIVSNAKQISKNNIKEIVITGVNIGTFLDPDTGQKFYDLIKELEKVKGIERYRISSIEPNLITDEIIDFIRKSKKFMPHFHIPLQSGSDKILRRMKRRYNTKTYKEKINKIIKKIPNVCIGADVIVGFPDESKEDFYDTVNFIKDLNISYLHVFSYSERENTEAINHKNKINKKNIKERSQILRILSNKLKNLHYEKYIGSTQTALFEQENKNGYIFGFTNNYIRIKSPFSKDLSQKKTKIKLLSHDNNGNINAEII